MNSRKAILTSILSLGCLILGIGLTGCGPRGASDLSLTTDIQAKMFSDPSVKAANVKVAVNNGIVTLTGDAPNSDVALQVVDIANATPGVKSVDNQLKIVSAVAQLPAASMSRGPTSQPVPSPKPLASNTPPPPLPQNMQPAPPPVDDTNPMVAAQPPPPEHEKRERREARAEMPAPPPPKPTSVTIPAGTDVSVRMIDSISSKTAEPGQNFRASLSAPLAVDGEAVIPTGAPVSILLDQAKSAGRIKGNSELEVRAVSIQYRGRTYNIETNVSEEKGQGRGKQSAIRTGIGAAAGGIIGAIAGGGKGAAIGTLAGGGAGAGYQLATHGQQVNIASETQLTFRLQAPLVVTTHGPE